MNSPDTYLWSFGDGTMSSEMNPEHTFALPGLYRVSLTVSNDAGSGSTSGYVVVRRPWGFF
jgi:PKD repeat protein